MKEINYEIDAGDSKNSIRFVRDALKIILSSPGAKNVESGLKKIKFYEWCISHPDGEDLFRKYCIEKRKKGDEVGFSAAGWNGDVR